MSFAGYRDRESSSVKRAGSFGHYWSSTARSYGNANRLGFNSLGMDPLEPRRSYGLSVRCFKNSPNQLLTIDAKG